MLDSDWWRDRRKGGGGLSLMSGRKRLTRMIFTNYSVVNQPIFSKTNFSTHTLTLAYSSLGHPLFEFLKCLK